MNEAVQRSVNEARPVVTPLVRTNDPEARRLNYVMADQLPEGDEAFDDELVESVIGRAAMAVLYGDSNSGKTFLAIDIGAALGLGTDWLGKRTAGDGGIVVYLATEAARSVELRLRSYQKRHNARVPGFVIVQSPINPFDGNADTTAVIALVDQLERAHNAKALLIIGDTLARISAGANENSGEDMGVVLKNADTIRGATGATFLWIHHCGKDQAKGMRGWSGMRAAIDTEIEVSADDATGVRTAEITKQRDLPGKGERIGFRLETVNLGVNRWGKPRGSCVVVPSEPTPRRQVGKRRSEVAGAIIELLNGRAGMKKGDIVKHFAERYDRATVYRELKKMLESESGRLYETANVYALRSAFKTEPAL